MLPQRSKPDQANLRLIPLRLLWLDETNGHVFHKGSLDQSSVVPLCLEALAAYQLSKLLMAPHCGMLQQLQVNS